MQSGWKEETRMSVLPDTRTAPAFFGGLGTYPGVDRTVKMMELIA